MPTYGSASVTGGDSRTTASSNIFGTLNVTGTVAQTATYMVTPFTSQCGPGSPFTLTVTVNPTVIIRSISRTIRRRGNVDLYGKGSTGRAGSDGRCYHIGS